MGLHSQRAGLDLGLWLLLDVDADHHRDLAVVIRLAFAEAVGPSALAGGFPDLAKTVGAAALLGRATGTAVAKAGGESMGQGELANDPQKAHVIIMMSPWDVLRMTGLMLALIRAAGSAGHCWGPRRGQKRPAEDRAEEQPPRGENQGRGSDRTGRPWRIFLEAGAQGTVTFNGARYVRMARGPSGATR
ncbi:unnamed protein product [Prorocentrum cordatum]|uniref:Uncharacterized protein n=1 Tax=Prorocentrum cordatum TaxID=2364126 RepID=A0ABN9X935_9DINO|nr:unnamed protein product [Polarella glacialis]